MGQLFIIQLFYRSFTLASYLNHFPGHTDIDLENTWFAYAEMLLMVYQEVDSIFYNSRIFSLSRMKPLPLLSCFWLG